jgi:hypothetical protein
VLGNARAGGGGKPIVSFFTRRPMVMAAMSTGDISPLMIWRMSESISS